MKLRVRLAAALAVLLLIGLVTFGIATYGTYARSERARLDDQLRASLPLVERELLSLAGLGEREPDRGRSGSGPGRTPPVAVPVGAYGELFDAAGLSVVRLTTRDSGSVPKDSGEPPVAGSFFTSPDAEGSGSWRLAASASTSATGYTIVAAIPTTDVDESLRRLLLIELIAGGLLIAALSAGSWFILRSGLRPLETMAIEAQAINAGELSQRVSFAAPGSEVGDLGLALNSMFGGIERAFEERDATERRLRQFLADASHELRTPLTSIQGFAEMFRIGGDKVDQPLAIRRIEQESARMRKLVEDLLTLARLDETRPVERNPVDLSILAADACSDVRAVAPDRAVVLEAPEPVVVLGDRDHLRQAVTNLVANAVRHTPAGSAISLRVGHRDGWARIEVADRGPGLSNEAIEHVFDRFWQADDTRRGDGSGLGLAIVSGIADQHGGSVTAGNRSGGGAVFTIVLPAAGEDR